MKIITPIDGKTILERIEQVAKICYKSENKITRDSEITVIELRFLAENTKGYLMWYAFCQCAEAAYYKLLDRGCTTQEAIRRWEYAI